MDYNTLLVNIEDTEFVDTLEDTGIDKISKNSVFVEYARKFLTLEGLSYLYENMQDIQEGITGDGSLIMLARIQKVIPVEITSLDSFVRNCIVFHIMVSKIVISLSFSKHSKSITEKELVKILKDISLRIFSIDFEPSFSHVKNFYELLKSHGYQGEFVHD